MASAREPLRIAATAHHRRKLILFGQLGDETYSTFVANDATPALDTPDTLTFTLKDANDDPIAGASVTYA